MSIRDQYRVVMVNGNEYTVAVTKQGGKVDMREEKGFFIISELTKGGLAVREVRVAKEAVNAIEYKPG